MPEENIKTTLQFQADISDFKAAMQEANRAVKLANSEFEEASAGMDDWKTSTDGLSAKLRSLTKVQEAEERKLEALKLAYAETAKEQGENSKAAQELQIKINKQQATINKAAKEYRQYSAKLEEMEAAADDAGKALEDLGDAAKDAGKDVEDSAGGWTIVKDVIADFVSNAIQSAISALGSLAEETREYRRDMALMAQNARDTGHDMEALKDTLSTVSATTGEADAAMEGLNMLMASGLNTADLETAAEAFAGAASRFSGLKFEGMAEGLQETLATGAAVGPFGELIERTGGNLEEFNEGMAACSTQAEKQQYVMDWLAKSGLKEVHDAYVKNNADLVEAEKQQFRYNEAMASIGAALEPLNTKISEIGATILEKVAPIVEKTVQWVLDNLPTIGPIIAGIAAALGVLAAALGIKKIIDGVTAAWGLLNIAMNANPVMLIVTAIAALVAGFITLWNTSEGFREFWVNLWEGIKNIFAGVGNWFKEKFEAAKNAVQNAWQGVTGFFSNVREGINTAFANIGNWFKDKFEAAKNAAQKAWAGVKNYFGNVKEGITNAVSNIDTWMGNKFGDAWTETKKKFAESTVGKYFGQIGNSIKGTFSAVKSALSGNFAEAWESVKGVFSGWGSFFTGLWDKAKAAFSNVWNNMSDVGKNVVRGLWEGLSNSFQWIKDKITGWVGNILDFIKKLFGIHSPSAVMRDEVGKMLGLGTAEGIDRSRSAVREAMRGLRDEVTGDPGPGRGGQGGGAVGGKTIIINQHNTSPKALSRREIYRQTHNALAYAGGM